MDQCIIAANHYSLFDTPMIFLAIPARLRSRTVTVGGLDYFQPRPEHSLAERTWRRIVIWFIRGSMNVALIDRVGGNYSKFDLLENVIQSGWNLMIFPEATRSRDGARGRFHLGAAELVRRSGLPLVPTRIEGTQQVLPPGVRWPQSGSIRIRFGSPMRVTEDETAGEFTNRIVQAIQDMDFESDASKAMAGRETAR
ncbi:MAG: 1-acyl-sn-glycerol-3-phosphate acyltransferase [Phycisphaerales bacterium]|nr:1-acyl-sn-glycerol-3-phosphate acyltransferase [Phycisphaerales bacterium]